MSEYSIRSSRKLTPIKHATAPDLPPEDHPAWAEMIKGTRPHDFSYAAAGMLVFNLSLQWRRDPSKLPKLVAQARVFFQKYCHLMHGDIQRIFS